MRFYYILFLHCFLFLTNLVAKAKDEPVLLLSFPRSGNTWTRYCIEFLTKRATLDRRFLPKHDFRTNTYWDYPLSNKLDLEVDYTKPFVFKAHNLTPKITRYPKYLILVVRNYKECFRRTFGGTKNIFDSMKIGTTWSEKARWYAENLNFYDQWDENKRLLLYYEDIISNPLEFLEKLVRFFDEGESLVSEMYDHLDMHISRSIEAYEAIGISCSKGKDLLYHSKQMSLEDKEKLDDWIMKEYPELFEKYLSRYQEKK